MELRLLSLPELRAIAADPVRLGDLRVDAGGLPPPTIVARAMVALDAGHDKVWHSFFVYVDPALGAVVGSGGFKGSPVDGSVEIGYNTAIAHRGKGIAGIGLRGLLDIAFAHARVREVLAETMIDNAASRRVLQKCGFAHAGHRSTAEDGRLDRWLLARDGWARAAARRAQSPVTL
jgi:RimJ/RimL family protein N-acetyltransferase